MNCVRFAALLAGILILLTGVAAAERVTPADLGRELTRLMSEYPPGFVLVQADQAPTASVDGHKGCRIVLRQEHVSGPWAEQQQIQLDEPVQASAPVITKWSHIDLVLIPDAEKVTSGLKNRIKWQDLAQQQYTRPVYMGKGHGYHWFTKTTIYWQDELRRGMKLTGGDSRVALAVEGLETEDDGSVTRESMHKVFEDLGDEAVPALQAAIRKHENDEPFRFMHMLGDIKTDKSTAALRAFYWSKASEVSRAAASVLAGFSVRPAARREYLDMLHRGYEVHLVAEKCAKQGWTEAVPDLESAMANPKNWWDFQSAYLAHRTLTGRPVSDALLESWHRFGWPGKDGDDARSALTSAEDKEAAAVFIIGHYRRYGKITRDAQEMHDRLVLEMLGKLPSGIVRPMVETAARSVTDPYDKKRLEELLSEL